MSSDPSSHRATDAAAEAGIAHRETGMSPNYSFVIRRALELADAASPRVLDYGCGVGKLVALAREQGHNFDGADTYEGHYANWSDAIVSGARGACTKIENGRIDAPDNHYNVVVSNQVFEHVFEPETALSEIARVLKPGGKFLALFPTNDVWFEGHLGVYFVHWLPARSGVQRQYLHALRKLGFGYYKKGKPADQWATDSQNVLNDAVIYRPKRDIDRLWQSAFGASPVSDTTDYMRFRLAASRLRPIAQFADVPVVREALAFVCHKRAGRILLVTNEKS